MYNMENVVTYRSHAPYETHVNFRYVQINKQPPEFGNHYILLNNLFFSVLPPLLATKLPNTFNRHAFYTIMISRQICSRMQTRISHRSASMRTGSQQSSSPHAPRRTNLTAPTALASQPTSRRPLLKLLGTGLMAGALSFQGRSVAAAASVPTTPESILEDPQFPAEFPFRADAFERYDEGSDTDFYSYPRFVTHIDDAAIEALTDYYSQVFPPSGSQDKALLDICSSWISHFPKGYTAGKISGLGMNGEELARNTVLTDFAVKDLNEDPVLPYPDGTFDVITNAVSVDYLTNPMEVFKAMHRVLKPGCLAVRSFSNR